MKEKTKRYLRLAFNLVKAVAIVASPHTFVAKVAEVLSACEALDRTNHKHKHK